MKASDKTQKELELLAKWAEKEEFEALLEKEPNNVEYLREFAYFLFDNNKYRKAIKYYKKIVEINKDDYYAYYDISEAYMVLGDNEKEEIYKIKALELAPMQILKFILKSKQTEFKKYAKIAQEKFPDDKKLNENITAVLKVLK